jgi:cysteine desulfurase
MRHLKAYMDYAAATPVDPRVLEAMLPYFAEYFGNPSSVHSYSHKAQEALNKARESVASLIGAESPDEVVFTSGATESNNLALKGVAYRNRDKGNKIVTTAIEHISILNVCKYLRSEGFEAVYVPVDRYGLVDVEKLAEAVDEKTLLVSVMYANGEIGTVEPIEEIGKIAHERNVPLHVDATAAAGKVPIDVVKEKIDLLTLSSNDLYGPKGVGALYIRRGVKLLPIIHGGGQERGLRSGSENIPGIVGMGKAAELAKREIQTEAERLTGLRDSLISGLLKEVPESYLNGHPTQRLPNNANVRFSYIEGESLLLGLDALGVQASSGSACTSKTLEPSHVLLAIGLKHEEAHGSVLFTLGKGNREEEVNYVVKVVPGTVRRLRTLSPLTPKELLR